MITLVSLETLKDFPEFLSSFKGKRVVVRDNKPLNTLSSLSITELPLKELLAGLTFTQGLKSLRPLRDRLKDYLDELLQEEGELLYVSPCYDPVNDDLIGELIYQVYLPEGKVKLLPYKPLEYILASFDGTLLQGVHYIRRVDHITLQSGEELRSALGKGFLITCVPQEIGKRFQDEGKHILIPAPWSGYVYLMPKALKELSDLMKLLNTMARVRLNCPWDVKQTSESIKSHLMEEAYEALEAVMKGDWEKFKEELGDVLLQVVFHSRIREDCGDFDFMDVVNSLVNKLRERHPHVFGYDSSGGIKKVTDLQDVLVNWENIKRKKGRELFTSIPRSMPPTFRFYLYMRKLQRLGVKEEHFRRALEILADENHENYMAKEVYEALGVIREHTQGISPLNLLVALLLVSAFEKVNLHDDLSYLVDQMINRSEEIIKELNIEEFREDNFLDFLRRLTQSLAVSLKSSPEVREQKKGGITDEPKS